MKILILTHPLSQLLYHLSSARSALPLVRGVDSQLHNAGLQVELGTYSEMQRKDYRLHLQSMTVQVESICGEKHTLNETENLDDISDPMSLTALLRHC